MNLLILITNTYPYGQQETFVHNEMSSLKEAFDHILLLPVYGHPTNSNDRVKKITIEIIPGECGDVGRVQQLLSIRSRSICEGLRQLTQPRTAARLSAIAYFEAIRQQSETAQKRIAERVRDLRPSRIVIYSYWFYTHALVAVDLKKHLVGFCPYVICVSRAHGFDLYDERSSSGYLPYRSYLLASLNHVFCCSRQGTDYLRIRHPEAADKISTAYLGVPDCWSGNIHKRQTPFHIVTCSRSVPVKRLDLWIKTLATICDIPIRWTHLGDGEEQAKLKATASELLPKNIQVDFRGSVPNNEIQDIYNTGKINLIVNTSSSEGLPVSLMEAFSCGIPALAPNVGGIPEIIDDGKNGFLFDEESSPETIAEKVRSIVDMDEVSYIALCQAARQKYVECFNDKKNYKMFFEKLLYLAESTH